MLGLKNKIVILITGLAALNMSMAAAQSQTNEYISAKYDVGNRTLTVDADLKEGKKTFLNIVVLPDGTELNQQEIKDNESVIIRTVQTDITGEITPEIIIPEEMQGKRFICYINTTQTDTKYRFSTVTLTELKTVVSKINSRDIVKAEDIEGIIKSDFVDIGLVGSEIENVRKLAEYIFNQKPSGGYSENGLLNTYMTAEGIAGIESGVLSVGEFVEEYAAYLEKDYAGEYDKLTEQEQKALEEMFDINATTDSFEKAFNSNLFIAKYRSAASSAELGGLITEYFNANGISMSAFNSISNKMHRDEIFAQLYRERKNVTDEDTIVTAFNALVKKYISAPSSGPSGTGGSGGSGGSGGRVNMTVEGPGVSASESYIFSDISAHWAKEQILKAYKEGIVNGFDNGQFMPDKNVTRAEFAKMLAQTLKLSSDVTSDTSFSDVSENDWYAECVIANAQAGIVTGDENKNFNPQSNITRQDVAVMIARALKYKSVELKKDSFGFNDEADFADYAKEAINGLADKGIINGYNDGIFAPYQTASRAEAIVMLMRMEELISENAN